jgi:16S rRNA C967 or C1407 C5-methylase (RsmB/RsmF family)/NOL1/NOP2/fmu family ribosome biogenesis protein
MIQLPNAFKQRLIHQLGEQVYLEFEAALNTDPPVSLRINKKKLNTELNYSKVSWCSSGYYLPERPLFVSDPLWHAGAYYVQEASSMVLEQAFVKIRELIDTELRVLDLCAAPGGKSTHISSLLTENDLLVSNEVIQTRVSVLKENLLKWGFPNTIICNNDSRDFAQLGEIFDIVVVDAPCSGEGLFRKDPNATEQWTEDNVQTCELRQKRILQEVIKCVKEGGFIIYSTCTYNPGENEAQVDFLTQNGFKSVPFHFDNKLESSFQLMPHTHQGEGFFIALLQKTETLTEDTNEREETQVKTEKLGTEWKELIKTDVEFFKFRNEITAVKPCLLEFYKQISKPLKVVHLGTGVGTQNQQLIIPSGELVFSQHFNSECWPSIELTLEQAILYIGKQIIPYSSSNKGYVTLTYKNIPIGLGKFAGNRINNLFPNEWRLRKQLKQEEIYTILP